MGIWDALWLMHPLYDGQGSTAIVRIGGKARYFGLVGLGPADKAAAVADWGTSVWQAAGAAIASAAKVAYTATVARCYTAATPDSLQVPTAA
jgi:hypothetical protein